MIALIADVDMLKCRANTTTNTMLNNIIRCVIVVNEVPRHLHVFTRVIEASLITTKATQNLVLFAKERFCLYLQIWLE